MSKVRNVLVLENLCKTYNPGMHNEVKAVCKLNLKVKRGDFVSIVGPSGSGKTTLLDMIGVLLRPTSGKVLIDGHDTSRMSDDNLARIRLKKIGFVFQQYNLIRTFTSLENVMLAFRIAGKRSKSEAIELLNMVGLEHRIHHRASLLSGGECQRVAIARALANDPEIILADEPTGNLDTKTSKKILNLMEWLNLERGYTFVVVTHDPEVTKYSHRIVYLRDGEKVKEVAKKDHKLVKI